MINNETILITGGTGSFGKNLVYHLQKNFKPKIFIQVNIGNQQIID